MMEICVKHLHKSYGETPVLRDVTFSAGSEIICVEGPSGAGKTTLLRLLLGLEKPDGGSISGAERLRWAAVFQEDRLLEHLDAAGNLRFALGADFRPQAAAELLADLGLPAVNGKPAREYSGGMKRRLALARALLAKSDALVLDEPFSGLDEESRARAEAVVRRRTAGKPVFLVTHDSGGADRFRASVFRLEKLSGEERGI